MFKNSQLWVACSPHRVECSYKFLAHEDRWNPRYVHSKSASNCHVVSRVTDITSNCSRRTNQIVRKVGRGEKKTGSQ